MSGDLIYSRSIRYLSGALLHEKEAFTTKNIIRDAQSTDVSTEPVSAVNCGQSFALCKLSRVGRSLDTDLFS